MTVVDQINTAASATSSFASQGMRHSGAMKRRAFVARLLRTKGVMLAKRVLKA